MGADYDALGAAVEKAWREEFPDADDQVLTDWLVIVGGAVMKADGTVICQVSTLVPDDQLFYRTVGLVSYTRARHAALIGED